MVDRPESGTRTRVPATAEWQAEMQRRRQAYAERRRRWLDAWFAGTRPEPSTDDDQPGRRSGRTIHDKRQFRLDF